MCYVRFASGGREITNECRIHLLAIFTDLLQLRQVLCDPFLPIVIQNSLVIIILAGFALLQTMQEDMHDLTSMLEGQSVSCSFPALSNPVVRCHEFSELWTVTSHRSSPRCYKLFFEISIQRRREISTELCGAQHVCVRDHHLRTSKGEEYQT